MPVYEYRQLPLNVSEQDSEYHGYFEAAPRSQARAEEVSRLRPAARRAGAGVPMVRINGLGVE